MYVTFILLNCMEFFLGGGYQIQDLVLARQRVFGILVLLFKDRYPIPVVENKRLKRLSHL